MAKININQAVVLIAIAGIIGYFLLTYKPISTTSHASVTGVMLEAV